MKSPKVLLPIALVALLASGAVNASAAPRLRVRSSIARAANDMGWYRAPVSYKLWATGPSPTVVSCGRGSIVRRADGTGIGFATLVRTVIPRCRLSGVAHETSISSFDLSVSAAEGRSASRTITVRLDRDPPAITTDIPTVPISTSPVHLAGAASDGFSGVRRVVLEFSDALDQQEPFQADAACPGCSATTSCSLRPSRAVCGSMVSWSFDGEVPSGLWSVTAVAFDLADNQTRSEPIQILVL